MKTLKNIACELICFWFFVINLVIDVWLGIVKGCKDAYHRWQDMRDYMVAW